MDDDQSAVTLDDPDLEQPASRVGTDDHGEAIVEVEHADWMIESVQHVLLPNAVLAGVRRDVHVTTHDTKLTCPRRHRKGVGANRRAVSEGETQQLNQLCDHAIRVPQRATDSGSQGFVTAISGPLTTPVTWANVV